MIAMELSKEDMHYLLGREPYFPDEVVRQYVHGSVVMVTGAGGSIGSELCLQLIALKPKTIVLFEAHEFALYKIDRELRETQPDVKIVPVLGTILDYDRLNLVLTTFRVDYVFHAAAYKHVPLVERNPIAAIENNTIGTDRLAQACCEAKVKKFLLVSTDKAVNPTNIMGASKRMAEFATLTKNDCPSTEMCIVRFGNVFWSSGSVLPLFYKQLTLHKMVTITDPRVTRYFMSISEAVGLIMEAMFLGQGKVYVLDMGKPILVEDMAKNLAKVLKIDDYEIKYIGLRDGEKLYEELALGGNLSPTSNPRILTADESIPDKWEVNGWLTTLSRSCKKGDIGALRALFQQVVPGYSPVCGIVDDAWVQEQVIGGLKHLGDCFENDV
jgi:FlaA1/EpsC-like NDP-sugar epimerase